MLDLLSGMMQRVQQAIRRGRKALVADWHGSRRAPFAFILLLMTSLATASFYVGQPMQPEFSYDTSSYLHVTQQILNTGNPVDALRTPGYPLFVALVFLVAGLNNFFAVAVVQGVLFVLATLEIYALTILLFRRTWLAFIVGALVGTNTYLLSFVKPIIVEGLALWLTVSLALLVVLFIKTLKLRYFWLVTGLMLLLFMTRPEWIYLPVLLLAYLLFAAWRRGSLRKFLPHSLAALVVLYGVLGLFVYVNATQNGYLGISYVERINLLGKVLQYKMQNEAPPQYAVVARELDTFSTNGGWNPYDLLTLHPDITANQWALGGNYASAIVEAHPLEFLAHSVVTFFTASNQYRAFSVLDAHGPVAAPPLKVEVYLSGYVAQTYRFFPIFALLWAILLFWRREARLKDVEAMGAVVLIALFELTLTTVGGYSDYDYARIHMPFDPLLIVVIWGTFLASIPLWESTLARLRLTGKTIWWVWGAALVAAVLGSIAYSWLSSGASAAFHPQNWLAVRLVVDHLPRLLSVVLLAAVITFFAYRASRHAPQTLAAPEEETPVKVLEYE